MIRLPAGSHFNTYVRNGRIWSSNSLPLIDLPAPFVLAVRAPFIPFDTDVVSNIPTTVALLRYGTLEAGYRRF